MSKNELKTFNVDMKLHGYITIQVHAKSKKAAEDILDNMEVSECFKYQSSEFFIEDSCIEYHEMHSIEEAS